MFPAQINPYLYHATRGGNIDTNRECQWLWAALYLHTHTHTCNGEFKTSPVASKACKSITRNVYSSGKASDKHKKAQHELISRQPLCPSEINSNTASQARVFERCTWIRFYIRNFKGWVITSQMYVADIPQWSFLVSWLVLYCTFQSRCFLMCLIIFKPGL